MRPGSAAAAAAGVAALVLAGCGAAGPGPHPDGGSGAGTVTGEVVVFAAASLTEAFTEIGEDFEAEHQGVTVTFNFAGSSTLAQQINQGAPADLFASASPQLMDVVRDERGLAGQPVVFARNRLEIAVPQGNPGNVTGLADFGRTDLTVALCAWQVPCGVAAEEVFGIAGIEPRPDTLERDVKAALTKVRLGEADAALVYHTDVRAADADVDGIGIPEARNAINDYPIAVLREARNAAAAKALLGYIASKQGQAVLAAAGFELP